MTKLQRTYRLTKPLTDELLKRISDAHGIYGFQKIQVVAPGMDKLLVEWDATRFSVAKMERALEGVGIPIAVE